VQSDDDFDKAMKIVKRRRRFVGENTGKRRTTHENIALAVAEGIRLGRREALTPSGYQPSGYQPKGPPPQEGPPSGGSAVKPKGNPVAPDK
jgi:hypothetical protein